MDEDPDGVLLAHASAEHAANVDMTQFISELAYCDGGLSYDPDYTAPLPTMPICSIQTWYITASSVGWMRCTSQMRQHGGSYLCRLSASICF